MKHTISVILTAIFISGLCHAGEKTALKEEKDRISYSVGYQVGGDFKRQKVELNPDLLVKGIQDALSGNRPLMSSGEMRKTLLELKKKIVSVQNEQMKEASEKNSATGKAFLEENGKKEGVITTRSGLQYKVIALGKGAPPKATDTVTVNYRGMLIDGTEFDSSYKRNRPATFQLNRVIKGWAEGLQLMKPGATYRFFIPPDLAYGERGAGRVVGPNSTLIFEVELISVEGAH